MSGESLHCASSRTLSLAVSGALLWHEVVRRRSSESLRFRLLKRKC
jgi:hypothetical protein